MIMITCSRCCAPVPDLTCVEQGDPDLAMANVPDGWCIADDVDASLVCVNCASVAEINSWMRDVEASVALISLMATVDDIDVPDEFGQT